MKEWKLSNSLLHVGCRVGRWGLTLVLMAALLTGTAALADTTPEGAAPSAAQVSADKDAAIDIAAQYLTEDDYGGLYVDDNGVCHIMLTDMSDAALFEELCVQIHPCTYTTNELFTIRDQVIEALADRVPLQASWIVERDNIVVFGIDATQEQAAQMNGDDSILKTIMQEGLPVSFVYPWEEGFLGPFVVENIPIVEKTTSEPSNIQPMGVDDYQTIHLGERVVSSGHLQGTSGFFAYEESGGHRLGFVTAGHVISAGQTASMIYGTVGTCSSSYIWPTIDCAFVPLNEYYKYGAKFVC